MQAGIYMILALLIGAITAVYLPMNSSVAKYLGSPLTASISFYTVALVTSIALFAIFGKAETVHNFKTVPLPLYLTGFISAFIVLSVTFLIPILGARKLAVLSIVARIVIAMVISHFGILTSAEDPINLKKIVGMIILIIGVIVSVS